jgi:hypothetical protein
MTSVTTSSIAEHEEREALKEHIEGLIVENKRLRDQIETLKVNELCINKSKEYAFKDLQELLEAIEGLLNAFPSATTHPAIRAARAAVYKATGENK